MDLLLRSPQLMVFLSHIARVLVGRTLWLGSGFVALSVLLAIPVDAQYFGRNKIQYERFDWHILQTEHFDIYYYPEMLELAEHGAHFAEEIYPELENRFAFSLGERVPLIFYSSNLHFKQTNVTPGFIPDGVGGFFEFLKGRVVVPANGDLHRFRRVIRHEITHVFTFSKLARVLRDRRRPVERVIPLWFTEGLAEYWSGAPDFQHEMIMRESIASNFFVPLSDMNRILGSYVMYKEGEAFCRFVSETYGEETLLELIENSWRDTDFREVMAFVLQEDAEDTSLRFTAWVREQYLPMLDNADVPTLTADAVTSRGLSLKPVVHMRPDSTREIIYVSNASGYTNVYAMPVDDEYRPEGDPEVLIRGERNAEFEAFHLFESRMDVSPDGLLAFVTQRGGQDVIHVYDLRARQRVGLYHFEDLVAVYSPSWNPDGRALAFTAIDQGGFADLYLYDRATEQLRQLTNDTYDDRDPDWSPDGRYLAFSSDRTAVGESGAYNLFTYDLTTDGIAYVTYGEQMDLSPRWSPDGQHLVFASARRQDDGKFSAQDLWVADMSRRPGTVPLAIEPPSMDDPGQSESDVPGGAVSRRPRDEGSTETPSRSEQAVLVTEALDEPAVPGRTLHRLTAFTGASFDPVWTADDRLVFASFEDFRFTVRQMDVDSLLASPRATITSSAPIDREPWAFDRLAVTDTTQRFRYRRKYQLDIAQGGVSTNPVFGTSGGATLAFSDMMGDDLWYVTGYSANTIGRSFLESLNLGVTRIHLGRRANYGYGIFRLAGQRYDRADPEAPAGFPVYYEQVYGGLGLVSYPLSKFRRIELGASVGYSQKDQFVSENALETVLLSNSVSLVHDNALYRGNGPIDGWRGNLTMGYTTDVLNSNVSYYTLSADVRKYFPITRGVTFASWGMARANVGRRARLHLLGGSWSMRGYPFLRLRARSLWFTSQELRFPLLRAPSAWIPLLAPFGITNVSGAGFVDVAHLWNDGYTDVELDPGSGFEIGRTLGSTGLGLRANLYGAFVLRYDLGYRFPDGFSWDKREAFGQFFFGWDF